jgi:hypothetical protein
VLPPDLLAPFRGPLTVELHVLHLLPYPLGPAAERRAA